MTDHSKNPFGIIALALVLARHSLLSKLSVGAAQTTQSRSLKAIMMLLTISRSNHKRNQHPDHIEFVTFPKAHPSCAETLK